MRIIISIKFFKDNPGSQILLDAIQEFEDWSNMRLNLGKTVVMDIDGGSGQQDPPTLTDGRLKYSKPKTAADI